MPFWFSAESRVLFAAVIALSVIVFFSLIVNGILIWRLRRAEPNNRTTIVNSGIPVPSGVHQASEPGVYMELQPRPSDGQSREPPEYQSLDDRRVTQVVYENVEWNASVLHLKKGADLRYSPSYQQHPWFWLCDILLNYPVVTSCLLQYCIVVTSLHVLIFFSVWNENDILWCHKHNTYWISRSYIIFLKVCPVNVICSRKLF